jgi:hypothetical protein
LLERAMTDETSSKKKQFSRLELIVLIPNLVLIGGIGFYFAATSAGKKEVQPLVKADPKTHVRIKELELALERNPGDLSMSIELSRLYQEVGEFPWSYDALRHAEENGSKEPSWRIKLGLAYLELAKNEDGLRVLRATRDRCEKEACPPHIRVKLDIFTRLAQRFVERHIDSRAQRTQADKALQEILKPVTVDPKKLGPQAPASQKTGSGSASAPRAKVPVPTSR